MNAVRRACLADAAGIARVHVLSWQAAYRGHMPDSLLDGLDVTQRTALWQKWLQDSRLGIFVAESEQAICGFSAFGPARSTDGGPRTAELGATYVLQDHWRHGVGRALLAVVLREAREAAFHDMVLWVLTANRQARLFYQSVGFAPDLVTRMETIAPSIDVEEVRYRCTLSSRLEASSAAPKN